MAIHLKDNIDNSIIETGSPDLGTISSKIHTVRNKRVMLDFDLAEMYGVETAQLKRAVRRNIRRFEGDDFMFELTSDEFLRCQNGISSHGGVRYAPFAFTELGVAMLSSVLRSETAIEVNRGIMRAFVAIRQMMANSPLATRLSTLEKNFEELKQDLDEIFTDYNDINEDTRAQLEAINHALADLQSKNHLKPHRRPIGFRNPEDNADNL